MDKRVYAAGFVLLAFVVLVKTSLLSSLFALLILGMIPGTNMTIPFWAMLIVYPLLFLIVVAWLSRQSLFIGGEPQKSVKPRTTPRKKPVVSRAKRTTAKRTAAKRRPRTAT